MRLSDRIVTRLAEALPGGRAPLRLERPRASVCFDDFPRSAWAAGGPILRRRGVSASFYPAGGFCGQFAERNDQFTAGDLREVRDAGHEIGCHSFSHRAAPALTARAFEDDLARNADFLRDAAGIAPATFAYPFGLLSPAAMAVAARRFRGSRRVRGGVNAQAFDPRRIAAVPLEARSWSAAGMESAVERAAERRGWLVLFTHDVSDHPTPFGCTPQMLEHALEALARREVEVMPVATALNRSTAEPGPISASAAASPGGRAALAASACR